MNPCRSGHRDPVEFNRKEGHVWLCMECSNQLAGPSLPLDQRAALIEMVMRIRLQKKHKIKKSHNGATAQQSKGDNMKLELAVVAGAESKAFLADLTTQIDRLEKLAGATVGSPAKKKAAAPVDEDEDTTTEETDEDDDFAAPAKKSAAKKAAAAAFDDEDDEVEEDEEETPAPKKKAKAKKITVDDVNDACKAYAKVHTFKATKALLKKKFKTESISEIDEDQYADVIAAMEV